LVYAGIKGYSLLAVLQNLVTGKPITTGVTVTNPLDTTVTPTLAPTGFVPAGDGSSNLVPANSSPKALGQSLAQSMGWTGTAWNDLDKLWTRESGWNPKAKNPSSGAYGIPQALPYTKMPKAAWPESAGGSSDARTQIFWGLEYIKSRYGSPIVAWSHEQQHNWY
jgi:hypothetical protein